MPTSRSRPVPSRGWVLIAAVSLVLGFIAAGLLHRVIATVEQRNFEVAINAFEEDLRQYFDDLVFQMRGFGVVVASVGGADRTEAVDRFLELAEATIDLDTAGVLATGGVQAVAFLEAPRADEPPRVVRTIGLFPSTERYLVDAAVEQYRASAQPVITGPVGPGDERRVVLIPSASGRAEDPVVAVLIMPDRFVAAALDEAGDGYLSVRVEADGHPVYQDVPTRDDFMLQRTADILGSPWVITAWAGPTYPISGAGIARATAAGFGLTVALLFLGMGTIDRRRREHQAAQLQLAEELVKSKDRFIASVSHELRTPLTVVHGFAEELAAASSGLSDLDVREAAQLIADQSGEMADLIEDLLVAARAEVGTMKVAAEPTELRPEVDAVCGRLSLGKRHMVEVTGSARPVMGDPLRIRQIIRNLVSNAQRHGGGRIVVHVIDGARPQLVVLDDGPGVPAEARDTIFQPYQNLHASLTQPASVGLGLTVARELARLMGGDIRYERRGDWSAFIVELPAAPVAATSPREAAAQPS